MVGPYPIILIQEVTKPTGKSEWNPSRSQR